MKFSYKDETEIAEQFNEWKRLLNELKSIKRFKKLNVDKFGIFAFLVISKLHRANSHKDIDFDTWYSIEGALERLRNRLNLAFYAKINNRQYKIIRKKIVTR